MLAQKAHTVGRQAQQPQLVGNGGLGFPQSFRRLLLRKAVGVAISRAMAAASSK